MYVLASYTFQKIPSPSLCEAVQRKLDELSPEIVLQIEGKCASVLAPHVGDWHSANVFYDFIEAMKATDTLREWKRRCALRRSNPVGLR